MIVGRATTVVMLSVALCTPSLAVAHDSGRSIEREAGDYLIDIGLPDPIVAGEPAYFDFQLWQKEPAGAADYTDAWVRITRGSETLFATGVHRSSLGTTGMLYAFAEPGTYRVSARYESDARTLAEVDFEVEVLPAEVDTLLSRSAPYAGAFVAGVVAACAALLLMRRRAARGGVLS